MNRFLRKNQKGFTLLEVMLVVLIIGIIAIIALPKLLVTKAVAEDKSCDSNLQALRTQAESWYWDLALYPAALADLLDPANGYFPADSTVSGFCPTGPTAYTYTVDNLVDPPTLSITCTNHPGN